MVINKNMCESLCLDDLIQEIQKVSGYVDYVQVTGGEPTLQSAQLEYIYRKIKSIGLEGSLDTNGSNPSIIEHLIRKKLIGHVAMDIKAPLEPEKYAKVAGVSQSFAKILIEKIKKSLELITKISFVEIRTTFVPNLVSEKDIMKIVDFLEAYLTRKDHYYILQQFVPNQNAPDPKYRQGDLANISFLYQIAEEIKKKLPKIAIRHIEGVDYIK